jgi:hypothetical protein
MHSKGESNARFERYHQFNHDPTQLFTIMRAVVVLVSLLAILAIADSKESVLVRCWYAVCELVGGLPDDPKGVTLSAAGNVR